MKNRQPLLIVSLITAIIGIQIFGGWFNPVFTGPLNNSAAGEPGQTPVADVTREMPLKTLAERQYIRLGGGWEWQDGPTGTQNLAVSRYNDVTIEGTFSGTWLDLYARQKGQTFDLDLDSAPTAHLTAPTTGQFGYFRVLKGLKRDLHRFRLRLANRAGGKLEALSFRTDGRWKPIIYPTRPKLMGFGSSTMDGCGITWGLAEAKGWEAINRGVGGTTVTKEGQFWVQRDVVPFQPDVVLINYGSNDWYGKIPLEQFKPAYLNMLKQLAGGLPEARFVVLGLFPRKGGDETTRPQFNQAIREAITASGAVDRTSYVEVANYDYEQDSLDGTHPSPAAVAAKFVPQLLPYIYVDTKSTSPVITNKGGSL
jgi:lysophospholipase L1-like esterase